MNKDGWPVATPYRYAGEPDTHIPPAAASGTYKLIQHGKDITATIKTPKTSGLTTTAPFPGNDRNLDNNGQQQSPNQPERHKL